MRVALRQTAYLSVSRARAGAVHIPLAELGARTHELPPPHKAIRLVCDSLEAYSALGWLHAQGRQARLVTISDVVGGDFDAPSARYRLWEPNEWLSAVLTSLPSAASSNADTAPLLGKTGEALDLGCGSGREAVYLADQGWHVIAVDRLPEALERGRDLQRRYAPHSPPIAWICADLEKPDWRPEGSFDLITLFYFYSRALVQQACAWLKPNGSLLVEAFTTEHRARYGKPASDQRVVHPGELPNLLPASLRVIHYSEAWRTNGRHTARLWAAHL